MLSRVEHVKSFITSGLSLRCWNMLLWYLAHIGSVVILPNGAEVEPIPCIKTKYKGYGLRFSRGWSGGAMALGKLLVSGRPADLDDSRARTSCACSRCGWGCLDIFTLIYPFSPLSPSLWETARYRLK